MEQGSSEPAARVFPPVDGSPFEPRAPYDVSVVVPTYNRRDLLAAALESLARQAGGVRYEIIVVDNASDDGTPAVVQAFAARWPGVSYLLEPRRGVSHARNAGVRAARAPVVAFLDDDVEADAEWIARIKEAFDTHPDIDCVGGRIYASRWAAPPPAWLTSDFWGPLALQVHDETNRLDATNASRCLMTANFACRKSALEEVGGFSPHYLRDEDRELQLRLWTAGKRGLYVGAIAVSTEVPPDRLTRSYHRRFFARAGGSHARMRYLDRIDAAGRLVAEPEPDAVTLCGTPGFVLRQLVSHLTRWVGCVMAGDGSRAFYHETRALYFVSYVWTRYRQDGSSIWSVPREIVRFAAALARRRRRPRERSLGAGTACPPRDAGNMGGPTAIRR